MTSLQTHAKPQPSVRVSLAQTASLTTEDWELIVEALGAYRHHSAFRAVYNKVKGLQAAA